MKTIILPPRHDANGQPISTFRINRENNGAKAVDLLNGICAGILADGVVTEAEAVFFADWVRKFSPHEPVWPFTDILERLDRIFADGRCDEEEREELKVVMSSLGSCDTASGATLSTSLPLNAPQPSPLLFAGKTFNITGKFAYGKRVAVMDAIAARGGQPSDSMPTQGSDYLVIGVFASRDWINTSHGRKIERAVELRDAGHGIAIVSEEHWKKHLVEAK